MKMNAFNIANAFKLKKERGWEKVYFAIDLHNTICPSKREKSGEHTDFYPHAKETLQMMSRRKDVCIILWTSSYILELNDTLKWLKDNEIRIDYVNENPECISTRLGDFSKKFWCSCIIDDKSGFEGKKDWLLVRQELDKCPEE